MLDELGWSERKLASEAQLKSASHVGHILRGTTPNPTLDTVIRLAEAGGVNLLWLATGEGPQHREPRTDSDRKWPHLMPAVRAMGIAQGFDPDVVKSWDPLLPFDVEPDAELLYHLLKVQCARKPPASLMEVARLLRELEKPPPTTPNPPQKRPGARR